MTNIPHLYFFYTLAFCFSLVAMDEHLANQSESLLYRLPKSELHMICEHLQNWQDINRLGATCKYLDETVTIPGKKICIHAIPTWSIVGQPRKLENFNSKNFPDVIHLMTRIALRKGSNPIDLDLSLSNLSDHMQQFETFLSTCANSMFINHITQLCIACNELTTLPQALSKFTHLEDFNAESNKLTADSLATIAQCTSLTKLNVSHNGLDKLHPDFACLTKLDNLDISDNKLTEKALDCLITLSKLEELYVSNNSLAYTQLINFLHKLPKKPRMVISDPPKETDNVFELEIPEGVKIYF